MKKINLEKIYEQFTNGNEEVKKKCIEEISVFIYFNYYIFFNGDRESVGDFLTTFFPNLRNIIEKYDPERSHIFVYLKNALKSAFSIFLRKQIYQKSISSKIHSDYYGEGFSEAQEPVPSYSAENLTKMKKVLKHAYRKDPIRNKARKNLESILICKCALKFDDKQIETLCTLFELNAEDMIKKVAYIRSKMQHIQKYESKYEEICFHNFYKKLVAEELLGKLEKDTYYYRKYFVRREAAQRFWKNNIRKIQNIKRVPSNRLVAEALNISRATVSRNIEKFRKSYYNENL
ncbi:MAG: hypothetical protein CR988_02600 [Treponema sp.]|nr:MAG: hypothetical protein CR988_02600 [Treponema sp.]